MTHELHIGETTIPYEVRFSGRATKQRIVVTPEGIEVVAPEGTPMRDVHGFVDRKRRWMFDAQREVAERHQKLLTQKYASGAKLQYRGRWLMLDIQPGDVDEVTIRCRSKFHVQVPHHLEGMERLERLRSAFDAWLRERALRDLERFGRRHARQLAVEPEGYRLSDAKRRWGSLGRDRVVRAHWRLSQAPAAAMEYVVAHELTHLLHRNHSPAFWKALGGTLPDWRERKQMLEDWETDHRAV